MKQHGNQIKKTIICYKIIQFLDYFYTFQAEWEALEISEHKWALRNVEDELMKDYKKNIAIYAEIKSKTDQC